MDRWKTLALTFGGLWALTLLGLVAALFTGPRAAQPTPDAVVIAAQDTSQRTEEALTPGSTRTVPAVERGSDAGGPLAVATTSGDDRAPAWLTDASQPLPGEVMQRAREQWRAERDDQREERRDEMADEIEGFIEDEGLPADQAETLRSTLDDFRDRIDTLRDSMRSGDVDFREVRGSMRDARDQLGTELDAQLGTEGADRLRERMFGGAARGPRRPL